MIGLDWGSSSLRALRLGTDGEVLEVRSSTQGASTLDGKPASFVAALDALIGDWHVVPAPVLACGMVGSQHGWREVPYADCPADAQALAAAALRVDWRGKSVHLLPGLRCETDAGDAGVPDVMRGEETQVLGALQLDASLAPRACIVLPGTHSKWARVTDGALLGFATHMTGELFAVLRQHSVLGRLMPADALADAGGDAQAAHAAQAFAAGVRAARAQGQLGLSHQLFAVRTLGLTGRLAHAVLPDYLSGLLIGHELRAGLAWRAAHQLADAPLLLIGEAALCQRYVAALALFDVGDVRVLPNTAPAGLWRLAQGRL